MSNPLLLAELNRFVDDEGLRQAAKIAVAHLCAGPPFDIEARRDRLSQADEREREFECLWELYIEPGGRESLNSGEASSPALTVRMAYQGAVVDHILKLFAEGGVWWQRAEEIVRKKVA